MEIDIKSIKISEETDQKFTCITKVVVEVNHLKIISESELHMRNDEENIDKIIDELSSLIPKLYDMNYSINNWEELIEFDQPNQISVNFFGRDELIDGIHEVMREDYVMNYPY